MDDYTLFTCLHHVINYHEKMYRAGKSEISDITFDTILRTYGDLADLLCVPDESRLDKKVGSDLTEDTE